MIKKVVAAVQPKPIIENVKDRPRVAQPVFPEIASDKRNAYAEGATEEAALPAAFVAAAIGASNGL